MTRDKEFKEITDQMLELYKAKNHDYGDSFSRSFEQYGMMAFSVRASDKMHRIDSLCSRSALVADEKMEDTLIDLANYAILAVLEIRSRRYEN